MYWCICWRFFVWILVLVVCFWGEDLFLWEFFFGILESVGVFGDGFFMIGWVLLLVGLSFNKFVLWNIVCGFGYWRIGNFLGINCIGVWKFNLWGKWKRDVGLKVYLVVEGLGWMVVGRVEWSIFCLLVCFFEFFGV